MITGLGQDYKSSAMEGFRSLAATSAKREEFNRSLKRQKETNRVNSVAQGAGMGFSVGGVWGAVIGAAAGLVLNEAM